MNNESMIQVLEGITNKLPNDDVEFWFARDLMAPLDYRKWENFTTAIKRAIESCITTGKEPDCHFHHPSSYHLQSSMKRNGQTEQLCECINKLADKLDRIDKQQLSDAKNEKILKTKHNIYYQTIIVTQEQDKRIAERQDK